MRILGNGSSHQHKEVKMGSRYYITGTQIGMIIAFIQVGNAKQIEELMQTILDKQYIGTKEEF